MSDLVKSERRAAAAVITYANPPRGTMTAAGAAQTYAAMKAAVEDDTVRAVVLTGGLPGVFIRHYDVGELADISDVLHGVVPLVAPAPSGPGFADLVDLIAAAPKPVIAAINGLCMGGGFEISLACDLRVAAPDVEAIGLPETRIGIFPGGGGTQRLPRVIGEARALEFILRGRTVSGAEAGEMGLVHEVAPDPLARALEIAAEFAVKGAEGVAAAKRLTRAALDRPLSDGLADERRSFVEVLKTRSAQDALRAASSPAVSIQQV
ncbi:enoyl-CoA hydratase [Caulobacter ginsengisoli]|uniref:Enoyl-CoA hydratase n=1 Tax=Caulobacter ginsengisoli TaxID=400775 RepID=A0ABU0ITV6_9CAUL|nr:enoyl-CoA hydratase [Caulobacter ginsengisoli]